MQRPTLCVEFGSETILCSHEMPRSETRVDAESDSETESFVFTEHVWLGIFRNFLAEFASACRIYPFLVI